MYDRVRLWCVSQFTALFINFRNRRSPNTIATTINGINDLGTAAGFFVDAGSTVAGWLRDQVGRDAHGVSLSSGEIERMLAEHRLYLVH